MHRMNTKKVDAGIVKHRLDVNDLLDRHKIEAREDKKKNLLILSLTIFIAAAIILILGFSYN